MVHGQLRIEVAGSWVVALVFSLAGMYVGQIVRQRTDEQVFRRTFFIGLLALGTYMCLRAKLAPDSSELALLLDSVLPLIRQLTATK